MNNEQPDNSKSETNLYSTKDFVDTTDNDLIPFDPTLVEYIRKKAEKFDLENSVSTATTSLLAGT